VIDVEEVDVNICAMIVVVIQLNVRADPDSISLQMEWHVLVS
jgi:hypothetical protein